MDTRRFAPPPQTFPPPSEKSSKPSPSKGNQGPVLRTGVLAQGDGSAYLEDADGTKILCSVFGPREMAKKSDFSIEGLLTTHWQWAQWEKQKGNEKELASALKVAIEGAVCLRLLPKSQVDVYIHVLEGGSGDACLSRAITCAGRAIAEASIPMLDLTVGKQTKGEKLTLLTGRLPNLDQISALHMEGFSTLDDVVAHLDS